MNDSIRTAADSAEELIPLLDGYLKERLVPHPILTRYLPAASACAMGSSVRFWDERSDLDLRFILSDDLRSALTQELLKSHLWDPARDCRVRLIDREPYRRYPGARITFLAGTELDRELRFDPPPALWSYTHCLVIQDPERTLERAVAAAGVRFDESVPDLRCEHYYRFRTARNDLAAAVEPRSAGTLLAIKRGEAVREALRLCFLADGRPYPPDLFLESMAESETAGGSAVVTAVRGLLVAREAEAVDHASKVLRDRVIFALQQGGVSDRWLEQWWMWPLMG
jgi:hypothetical protein